MKESMPPCSSCQSDSVVKNGRTRHGKQNYKCRDCNRQFVKDPQWQRVTDRIQKTYDLVEQLDGQGYFILNKTLSVLRLKPALR